MTDHTILLDPTDERAPAQRQRLARPERLTGLTIGLLDISKPRGDIFLAEIEAQLTRQGLSVKRFKKPTFARVAPVALKQELTAQCDVIIEALAD
jgi:hypothetical protein